MKIVSCLLTFLVGLLLSAMLGCDDGTYESRYNERLTNNPVPVKKSDDADDQARLHLSMLAGELSLMRAEDGPTVTRRRGTTS